MAINYSPMKVIIPCAGLGIRLYPKTKNCPKILLEYREKPVIDHIIDSVVSVIEDAEFIFVVCPRFGDRIERYMKWNYPNLSPRVRYVEQTEPLGFGHAVLQARHHFKWLEPALIHVSDAIYEFSDFDRSVSWVSAHVSDNPSVAATIEMDGDYIERIIEKPDNPTTNFVSSGIFYITNALGLFVALANNVKKNKRTKGEFQLIDAIQVLVEQGTEITTMDLPRVSIDEKIFDELQVPKGIR